MKHGKTSKQGLKRVPQPRRYGLSTKRFENILLRVASPNKWAWSEPRANSGVLGLGKIAMKQTSFCCRSVLSQMFCCQLRSQKFCWNLKLQILFRDTFPDFCCSILLDRHLSVWPKVSKVGSCGEAGSGRRVAQGDRSVHDGTSFERTPTSGLWRTSVVFWDIRKKIAPCVFFDVRLGRNMKCALFFPRFSGQSWIRRESCKYNLIKDNRRFCGFCEKNARVFIQNAVFMYKSAIQIFYKFARSVGVLVLPGARVPIGEGQARAIMGGFFRSSIRVSWLRKKRNLKKTCEILSIRGIKWGITWVVKRAWHDSKKCQPSKNWNMFTS